MASTFLLLHEAPPGLRSMVVGSAPGPPHLLSQPHDLYLSALCPPSCGSSMFEEKSTTAPNCYGQSSRREHRSHPRRRGRGKTFALFIIRPSLQCFRVTLWDASTHGISFLHDAPLERGTLLALQLRAGMPGSSRVRTAHVAHATRQGEKWLIGCRISPPLSDIELESL